MSSAVAIKFCGLMRPEDVGAAVTLGADYGGVIFADGPRRLTPERARDLLEPVSMRLQTVGVFGVNDPDEIAPVASLVGLRVIQLHADPTAADVERVRDRTGCLVWAVIRVGRPPGRDAAALGELRSVADAVVLDSWSASRLGGGGATFPWKSVAEAAAPGRGAPIVLAGGLTADNVADAIEVLRPAVVDVSSGVEKSPGVKDHDQMRAFAAAVRGK
ncbi:MAG: phosphoribosylanthranilate isomerase [Gemmatimonadota bacterium]|nr:phosphoribosylanthranilate isomerase [Gemmatimonadota bacterium]MDQ6886778.1 phosphoribosylanthranilate isomerase [Gemmatimonadota bacterium]